MTKKRPIGFSTPAIHVGQEPDLLTGSVTAPIHPTSTYAQEEIGKNKGYEYSRVSNPTRTRSGKKSGVARRRTHLACVRQRHGGSHRALQLHERPATTSSADSNVYGGVPRLFNQVMSNYGIEFTYVDTTNLAASKKPCARTQVRLDRVADESADGAH